MSKNAQYVDMEANVTVSLSAEILGKRNTTAVKEPGIEENTQAQLLWSLIRNLSGMDNPLDSECVIE